MIWPQEVTLARWINLNPRVRCAFGNVLSLSIGGRLVCLKMLFHVPHSTKNSLAYRTKTLCGSRGVYGDWWNIWFIFTGIDTADPNSWLHVIQVSFVILHLFTLSLVLYLQASLDKFYERSAVKRCVCCCCVNLSAILTVNYFSNPLLMDTLHVAFDRGNCNFFITEVAFLQVWFFNWSLLFFG